MSVHPDLLDAMIAQAELDFHNAAREVRDAEEHLRIVREYHQRCIMTCSRLQAEREAARARLAMQEGD